MLKRGLGKVVDVKAQQRARLAGKSSNLAPDTV
jgi:hypothetical protein